MDTAKTSNLRETALLVIDMPNDFVADDGGLTVGKPAQAIVPFITEQCQEVFMGDGLVIFPTDNHPGGIDGQWPKHCDPTTDGVKLYGAIGEWYEKHKQYGNVLYLPKTKYNAFWGTDLAN